ncbi:MAG TPA: hypothetical protein VG368_01670, partial [Acidimicrobiales bacterium]|nr:hypothetical protein [Acidimicrobiales bacterium]
SHRSKRPTPDDFGSDVAVRVARLDDLEAVVNLLTTSRASLSDSLASEYLLDSLGVDSIDASSVGDLFEDGANTILIGSYAHADCGILVGRHSAKSARRPVVTVPWIAVDEGFRRCGVGTAMLSTLRAMIAGRGGGVLDVLAAPGDRATKSLLENTGSKARSLVMSQVVDGQHDGRDDHGVI